MSAFEPQRDRFFDVLPRFFARGSPGVAALQRRDEDVETFFVWLVDHLESLDDFACHLFDYRAVHTFSFGV